MRIARVLYPVKVLGPGKRVAIWFVGCPHYCQGCSNPELWQADDSQHISVQGLTKLIEEISAKNEVDGFTLTGGDPMMQYHEMIELVHKLKSISPDVLVYTGYTIEELSSVDLTGISVLIDGRYVQEKNTGCALRGSENQRIIYLEEEFRSVYEEYIKNSELYCVQNFMGASNVISVGIHKKGFSF